MRFRSWIPGVFCCAAILAQAQPYEISTYAGGAPPPTPAPGVNLPVQNGGTLGVSTDADGNAYFTSFNCIFKSDQRGVVTRLAGTSRPGYSGDGGPATRARLHLVERFSVGNSGAPLPAQLTVDTLGNVYIADNGNNRVRKISPDGIITTVAANTPGSEIGGLAVDAAGNLFMADPIGNRIREVSAEGVITTVAGTGSCGFSGDGGLAVAASVCHPLGLATDTSGNLFIADNGNSRVRRISAHGIITTVAVDTPVQEPVSVAVDQSGNLYVSDTTVDEYEGDFVQVVRKISPAGSVSTVAGTGAKCNWNIFGGDCDFTLGDGRSASAAVLHGPLGIALDPAGNVFIAETWNARVRRVSVDGIISSVAGVPPVSVRDGVRATRTNLFFPRGVAVDSAGNVFIADSDNQRIRKVSTDGIITTVAGKGTAGVSGDGGLATNAQLAYPYSVAVDGAGNLFIGDVPNGIRKVSVEGIITTVAAPPRLGYVYNVAVDGAGNLFFDDFSNQIRKVSPDGSITLVAHGYGPAVDGAGNLFFLSGYRVLKLAPDGNITTTAGKGTKGFSGDGGLATDAELDGDALAVDGAGNIFISDYYNNRIRKVSTDGVIATIAGNGTPGYSGDHGPATEASIFMPFSIAVDGAGNVYFADAYDNAVRVLRPVN